MKTNKKHNINLGSFKDWEKTAQAIEQYSLGTYGERDIYELPNGVGLIHDIYFSHNFFKSIKESCLVELVLKNNNDMKKLVSKYGGEIDDEFGYVQKGFGFAYFSGTDCLEKAFSFVKNEYDNLPKIWKSDGKYDEIFSETYDSHNLKNIIIDQVKDVISEIISEQRIDDLYNSPDKKHTHWTESDILWMDNLKLIYDHNDRSYSREYQNGNIVVLVQKPMRGVYQIKIIDYTTGKTKIPYNDEQITQNEMINSLMDAMGKIPDC